MITDFLKEEMDRLQINTSNIFNSVWTLTMLPFQIWLWMAMVPFRLIHWALWGEDLVSKVGKGKLFVPKEISQVISPREEKKELPSAYLKQELNKEELPSYKERVAELIQKEEYQSLDPQTRQVLIQMIANSSARPINGPNLPAQQWGHVEVTSPSTIREKSAEELIQGFRAARVAQPSPRTTAVQLKYKQLEKSLKAGAERYPTMVSGEKKQKTEKPSSERITKAQPERYPTLFQVPKEEEKKGEEKKEEEKKEITEEIVFEGELANRRKEKKKERRKEKHREMVHEKVQQALKDFIPSLNLSKEHGDGLLEEYTKQFSRNLIELEKLLSHYPFLVKAHPNDAVMAFNKMNKWELNLFQDLKKDEANNLREQLRDEIASLNLEEIHQKTKHIKEERLASTERKTFDKVLEEIVPDSSHQGKHVRQREVQLASERDRETKKQHKVVHAV